MLAHCRKDKSILWNFKKLFRAYFNHHGDVECEGCKHLAKYGRSSKCSYGQCNKCVTIIQINNSENWANCVRYIADQEDGRSDVEPEDEEVGRCDKHCNHDDYCTGCAEYKLSTQSYDYNKRKRGDRGSESDMEIQNEEEEPKEKDIRRCLKCKRVEEKVTDTEFREFLKWKRMQQSTNENATNETEPEGPSTTNDDRPGPSNRSDNEV